nr:hypothetical protein BaRGS_017115 [Batillaria attramentaria]
MSRYFDAMFSSGMLECQAGEVFLHNVHAAPFDTVLHFMYGKNVELTMDEVYEVLEMSSVYQIPALQSKCEKFLGNDLSINNCLARWKLSSLYSCSWLGEHAWEVIVQNFKALSATEDFMMLSREELIRIITEERLEVDNEEDVCEAVLRWLEHGQDATSPRQDAILDLFKHLKLPLMSQHYLEALLTRKLYLREHSKCCALINKFAHRQRQALRGAVPLDDSDLAGMFKERSEDVLVMVDGRRQEVVCFSLRCKKLFSLAKFPYFADGKAACVHTGDIFVSGGTTGSVENRLVRFMTERNRWDECQPMQEGRCYHSLVSVGKHLYALGGFLTNEPVSGVECFKAADNAWDKVGDLAVPIGGMAAAALDNTIYMFGGRQNRLEKETAVFQSFDTKTHTACVISVLPHPICWSQAVVVDNVIRVFCPNGHVLAFDGNGPPAIIKLSPKLECTYFSVVYHHGTFIFIQVGDAKYHDELRIFHPDTGEVHITRERLPRSLCDSKWMKVLINRRHLKYECSYPTHR